MSGCSLFTIKLTYVGMAGLQGCYVGAETLSKLSNLDAVKQQLWGLQLTSEAASGDLILGGSPKECHTCILWVPHIHWDMLLCFACAP